MTIEAVSVGLDLGGTASRFVAVDSDDQVLRQFIVGTPSSGSKDVAIRFLVEHVRQVVGTGSVVSIGIGASGPIDGNGIIRNYETLPAFSGLDVVAGIADVFHLRASIENDAVTAAVGEHRLGAARGADNALVVTLGTGVGVCLLQHGAPFRGSDGTHPEASHIAVSGRAAPCYCGRTACWEQTASRKALQAAATSAVPEPTNTSADIESAMERAQSGDVESLRVFDEYGSALAEGLADLIAIYAPDRVVLGGSGSNYLAAYGSSLHRSLGRIDGLDVGSVIPAELGEYGGAIGAALAGRH